MNLTIEVWRTKPNLKVFLVFLALIIALIVAGAILASDTPMALLFAIAIFALIPVVILSPLALGKHECITVEVLGEAEIDMGRRVRELWWLYAIPIAAFTFFGLITGQYNSIIYALEILFLILIFSRQRLKVSITDKGVVFGRSLLVDWNEIKNAEVKDSYVIVRKNALQHFVIPVDVIERYLQLIEHV
jgi:lysylphosphatidylglycerol synthetase-like protein (DUF2156 family)